MNYKLATSTWDSREVFAINRVVNSGKFTMGSEVREFELAFAKFFGSKHAVMVNSGSSANLILLSSLKYRKNGIKPGMEIIVPAVSWATTYYPVIQAGFKLKFVDIDLNSLNISIEKVEQAINENTAAIFAVNLLGQPAELNKLQEIANSNNILLLEDNCESMGATLNSKQAGTFGIAGSFSTFFSHHISTMEGGMLVTDDDELKDIFLSLRAHGWTRELGDENNVFNKTGEAWEDLYRFVLPGYNLRPLEISGAIGLEQLAKLPEIINMRIKNHRFFQQLFSGLNGVRIQQGEGISSSFGFSLILEKNAKIYRNDLVKHLMKNGIETRPIVSGNFLRQPVIKYLSLDQIPDCPNADEVHNNGFFLGNHHFDITEELVHAHKVISSLV